MKFYVVINGEQKGPFDIGGLKAQGIGPDTLVWKEGYAGWVKAATVPELAGIFAPPPPPHEGSYGYSAQPDMASQPMGPMPKTWLVESIVATVLCCLPLGIAALVNAADVESCYRVGRYADAVKKSQNAKNWLIWSVVCSVLLWVGIIVFFTFFGLAIANMH